MVRNRFRASSHCATISDTKALRSINGVRLSYIISTLASFCRVASALLTFGTATSQFDFKTQVVPDGDELRSAFHPVHFDYAIPGLSHVRDVLGLRNFLRHHLPDFEQLLARFAETLRPHVDLIHDKRGGTLV